MRWLLLDTDVQTIKNGDKSITEITCHARGAHFLNPEVRTVIDIGGTGQQGDPTG